MADTPETKLVIIAAGGTGGHMFPARAFADEMSVTNKLFHSKNNFFFANLNKLINIITAIVKRNCPLLYTACRTIRQGWFGIKIKNLTC